MSPHLRNLLEEAADDGGRPVRLDLASVRAAGRRATWRHRALAGGGGIAAAAVITSVALVVAPGGPEPSGFGPGGSGTSAPRATPTADEYGVYADELTAALAPLVDALAERGYEAVTDGTLGGGAVTVVDAYGQTGEAGTASALVLPVVKDGGTGVAVVAEFTDVAALSQIVEGDPPADGLCAVVPALDATGFGWDTCDRLGDDDSIRHQSATGGGGDSDAVGVTLIRPDDSGISVSLSTASFDRPDGEPTHPLGEVPLTAEQLLAVVDQLDARAPLAPPMLPPPTAVAEAPPSDFPCLGDAPPPECLPMDGAFVEVGPLVDALLDKGLEVVTMSESVGESSDSAASSTVLQFAVTDRAGRMGSAAIGVYDDLESARQAGAGTTEAASWCAVPPVERPEFAWSVAGDGPACTGLEHSGVAQMLGFYHLEDAGDAVGATLVRSDGSVISVSVGQAPAAEISSDATPLAAAPLNVADLLALLVQLDAGNREP